MRFKRPRFQSSFGEQLEDRSMLSGTPLDLDLSAVPTQTVFAGETLSFNLGELGATVGEGEGGPGTVMYQLDPDADERPEGMSMTFSGDFQWTPTAEQEGLYSVKIIAVENGNPINADVEELMIDVRVGRPVVDLNGEEQEGVDYDAVFQVEHGPVNVVSGDVSVSDENDDLLQSATITLTNPLDGADEGLSVNVEGTNINVEYSEGSILLTGEDTAENYAQVLQTLTYDNANSDADPTSRIVEISVSDGEYESTVATATIAVNHAPDLQPIEDQSIEAGQSAEVVITATDKNEGDELFLLLDVETPEYVTLTQEPGTWEATLGIAPGADVEPGEYVIRVMSIDQHGMADAESFVLTVSAAANTAPTISSVDDQSIDQDAATDPLAFTIGDAESAVEDLIVSVESDNPALVDPAGIIVTGEGADKTLVVTPLATATGTANITISVSDGEETTTESFLLTVNEVMANTAPTITSVDDQSIDQDTATDPLAFAIGDAESAIEDLIVSVESDNPALVDPAGIIVTGEGADKTLIVTPLAGLTGTANITISVSDGEETTTESFLLTVNQVVANTAPTVTSVDDQTIDQDSATDPLAFTIGDAESAVEDLTFSVESDNPALVDPAGILVAGEGADKTLIVTPLAGLTGTANITISVSDGEETTTESFLLTVNEVVANTAPTITSVEDQAIDQDSATDPLAFTIGDAESAIEDLTVVVESDNPALVDPAGIIVTGEGADKTLIVTPLAGTFGSANVTISVSDGEETTTESFVLTVNEVTASPLAELDSYATDANTPLSVDPAGVLTNDTGDALSVTEVNGDAVNVGNPVELTSGATVTINADGSLSFDPAGKYASLAEGESTVETVSYTATDSSAGTATADVEISITGVNDAPIATDDAYATESDTALSLTVTGVLANDTDVDNGDTMTITAVNGVAEDVGQTVELTSGALLTLNADGGMTFDPNGQFEDLAEPANVSFSYTIADSHGLTSEATVVVTVSAPSGVANENAAPINSVPGEQATDNDTPLVFDAAGGNAITVSDMDAGDAMVEVTVSVDNGVLTLANGFESFRHKLLGSIDQINSLLNGLVYTPTAGFEGTATLTVVTDDLGNTGFGGAKADADSVLIAVAAAAATGGVEGSADAPASEGDSVDSIVGSDDDLDDLFNPCHFA
ncbi:MULTISPECIES: beta strand repeat-containing protein [Pirellulaceae]|nr:MULTISPECIES: Ig-like domain-containing protein [Pirellulaceae]